MHSPISDLRLSQMTGSLEQNHYFKLSLLEVLRLIGCGCISVLHPCLLVSVCVSRSDFYSELGYREDPHLITLGLVCCSIINAELYVTVI